MKIGYNDNFRSVIVNSKSQCLVHLFEGVLDRITLARC